MSFSSLGTLRIAVVLGCASLISACSGQPLEAGESGLRRLSPVQVFAAPQPHVAPPQPLAGNPSEPADDTHIFTNAADSIPDISYGFSWSPGDTRIWRPSHVSRSSPGLRSSKGGRRPWRVTRPTPTTSSPTLWARGAQNWRYSGDEGLDVTLGNDEIVVPAWGNSTRLSGVSVSQSSLVGDEDIENNWQYALAIGALDASSADGGDLNLGPTAGNSVLRYGLSPSFTLESQMQVAPDLIATGLGGKYNTAWGVWSAGLSHAEGDGHDGWRYQAAYQMDITDDLQLSWLNERRGPGYADLSRYTADPSVGSVRQKWTATMPMGRWGEFSGVYENERSSLGDARRSFGFSQQFWYSPNLRVGLEAEREIVSGDYDIGIRFSVPIF